MPGDQILGFRAGRIVSQHVGSYMFFGQLDLQSVWASDWRGRRLLGLRMEGVGLVKNRLEHCCSVSTLNP